jgi:hypothetical protein
MDAPANLPDAGDVLSIGRRYRTAMDRLDTLDERWTSMADDAPGKWDTAAAAQAALEDAERLLLSTFQRRTETVGDIAVMAAHAFVVLDRAVHAREEPDPAVELALRGLADIATTAAKAAGLDFSMIGPPCLPARFRTCRSRCSR